MSWFGEFVGIPFGDGPGEIHCWNLVALVFAERRGIELPTYRISSDDHLAVHRAIKHGADEEHWLPAKFPAQFDVCVMRHPRTSRVGHVGVMVDGKRVLHVEAASASVIVPINHISVRDRIMGFRRYSAK